MQALSLRGPEKWAKDAGREGGHVADSLFIIILHRHKVMVQANPVPRLSTCRELPHFSHPLTFSGFSWMFGGEAAAAALEREG
jgi:hypothetical protein